MAQPSKRANEGTEAATATTTLARLAEQSQLDFELEFFAAVLDRHAGYVDVLRAHGNNLTLKGRYADGLEIDKKLIQLRPTDALAHYNLACSYALLKKPELALKTLRRAVELGYRDFRYMREDRDLESIRHDPRFRQLLREYENR
jgi:tetratricopeptide (TPR) repeat protein